MDSLESVIAAGAKLSGKRRSNFCSLAKPTFPGFWASRPP
jgi:hypothetical protein